MNIVAGVPPKKPAAVGGDSTTMRKPPVDLTVLAREKPTVLADAVLYVDLTVVARLRRVSERPRRVSDRPRRAPSSGPSSVFSATVYELATVFARFTPW